MAEREKVIKALKWCIDKPCTPHCPYFNQQDESQAYCLFRKILPDALALIKEQEARVLTVEEIRSGAVEVAWIEDADKAEVIPGIWFRLSNEGEDEAVDIHIRDGFVGARIEVYGKLWRCWTARPTEEQRKAVKWDA